MERQRNRYGTFGYSSIKRVLDAAKVDVPTTLGESLAFCSSAAPLIADGLKGNPRQVKRFLNALLLRKNLARVAHLAGIRDDVLVKLMILEYTQDKLFAELYEWQAQNEGKPPQLKALEEWVARADVDDEGAKRFDAKWITPRAKRWLSMDPKLEPEDLRDYLWVARDRLRSWSRLANVYTVRSGTSARGENPKTSITIAQSERDRNNARRVAARYTYPLSSMGKKKDSLAESSISRICVALSIG